MKALLRRWMLAPTMLLMVCCPLLASNSAENRAFNAAAESFRGGFYERAQGEFSDFARKFPKSPRVPEAILFQAEACIHLKNHTAAIELLSSRYGTNAAVADQYAFWLGEACLRKGDYARAAGQFEKLARDFPLSPRRLEAAIGEASARAALGEWPRVSDLLRQTNGAFQSASRTNPAQPLVQSGYLLLSEALSAAKDYQGAEAALQPLTNLQLNPKAAWQSQYLLCRIKLASGRAGQALLHTTNLLALATTTAQPNLQAQSFSIQASILERLGMVDEAIAAYTNNLADRVPPERQREALLKTTELSLGQNKVGQAARMLEKFLAQYPAAESADLALLSLGELKLRQHLAEGQRATTDTYLTNAPGATNYLHEALSLFAGFSKRFPQTALMGKAQLDLGWCYWLEHRWPESRAAFQNAAERLAAGPDKAVAHFKLADTEFQLGNFQAALTNYNTVVEKFANLPEVRTNYLERALYQVVRAALADNNENAATNALTQIQANYPEGFHTERAVLLTGQEVSRRNPRLARDIFSEFIRKAPQSLLVPDIQLAVARTYEEENDWPSAITHYEAWLTCFTNHPGRPRAQYRCAYAYFQAGRETNALSCYTNLVACYPNSEFAPLAQWWIADYYYRVPNPVEAEKNYQLLFLNTNWPTSELTYQARMMAGRAAVARQGWSDAIRYFTNLTSDVNCPADLWLQAMFAYGDTLMSLETPDFETAVGIFSKIAQQATNRLAVLAWGQKANCLLQWGRYELASNAFQRVIESPQADPAARSNAKAGLAVILEAQAEQRTGPDQLTLFQLSLDHYLDVFFGKILRDGEKADPFWTQKAGLEAGRLAEKLRQWPQAVKIYERLRELLPALRAKCDKKILDARQKMERDVVPAPTQGSQG